MAEGKTKKTYRKKFKTTWKTPAKKRNFFRTADGGWVLKRHSRGTRSEVWHHTAHHTVGGLTKKDLIKNKRGHIVPKSRVNQGHKQARYLRDLGYCTQKNRFQLFPKEWKVAADRHDQSLERRKSGRSKKFCGPMDRLMNPRAPSYRVPRAPPNSAASPSPLKADSVRPMSLDYKRSAIASAKRSRSSAKRSRTSSKRSASASSIKVSSAPKKARGRPKGSKKTTANAAPAPAGRVTRASVAAAAQPPRYNLRDRGKK